MNKFTRTFFSSILFLSLALSPFSVHSQPLDQLPELTNPDFGDFTVVVHDPTSIFATTQKVKLSNIATLFNSPSQLGLPYVDIRTFMDGVAGRPTYATWVANQGTTDVAVVVQAAIDSLTTGGTIYAPVGIYLIGSTITFGSSYPYPVNLTGFGTRATFFKWAGNNSTPMFDLQGVRDSTFEKFTILGNASYPLLYGMRSITTLGRVNSDITFRDIYVDGVKVSPSQTIGTGFVFQPGTGGDSNNDFMNFDHVTVVFCSNACFSFQHGQSRVHTFYQCNLNGTPYGIRTDEGAGTQGGSFRWIAGGGGNITDTIFMLGAANDPIQINGGVWEGFGTFLKANNFGGSGSGITIQGIVGNPSTFFNANNRYMEFGNDALAGPAGSPIVLINNWFGGVGINGRICTNMTGDLIFIGNVFKNDFATTGHTDFIEYLYANYPRVVSFGNRRQNNAGTTTSWNNDTNDRLRTLANSATPSVLGGKNFLTGGTTPITNFTDGQDGQEIRIVSEHSITITDGTNIFLNGSANFVMKDTDTLTLIQKADGKWYELARSVN